MSSPFEPPEPIINFTETAYLGKLCFTRPDVTLTYHTTSRSMFDFSRISDSFCSPFQMYMYLGFMWILSGFTVQNGRIVNRTAVHGISTTLTIVSDNGHRFTVTRERGGSMNHVYNVFILHEETCQSSWELEVTSLQRLKSMLFVFHLRVLYQQCVHLGSYWLDSKKSIIR